MRAEEIAALVVGVLLMSLMGALYIRIGKGKDGASTGSWFGR